MQSIELFLAFRDFKDHVLKVLQISQKTITAATCPPKQANYAQGNIPITNQCQPGRRGVNHVT